MQVGDVIAFSTINVHHVVLQGGRGDVPRSLPMIADTLRSVHMSSYGSRTRYDTPM